VLATQSAITYMQNVQLKRHSGHRNAQSRPIARLFTISLLAAIVTVSPALAQSSYATPRHATNVPGNAALARARSDTGGTASVTGTVYDSVANSPLGGAEVQLVDLANKAKVYTVRADSLGRFHIAAMSPGRYAAGFFDPALDALGIEPPLRSATINAGADNVLELVIPGPARIMSAVCGARPAVDSSGAMAGIVRDADSGLPIAGAKVVVTWREIIIDKRGLISEQRRAPAETNDDGDYRICGLPGADTVLGSAEATGRRSGVIGVGIPIGGIVRRDFALGDSATAVAVVPNPHASAEVQRETTVLRGSSTLSGIVRGPDGKAVQGAKILVWGTGLEATTRGDGHFTLGGLPAGTFSVEARLIGFEPKRVAVDLSDRTPASVDIVFKERVQELSRVVVMGKPSNIAIDIDGFLRRARTGQGHYITAQDAVLKNAFDVTDALRTTPGIQIEPSGEFGVVILMRGHCSPVVYVDGNEMTDGSTSLDDIIPPQQVAGIEVYAGLGEAPIQYRSNGCGTILVWSKR